MRAKRFFFVLLGLLVLSILAAGASIYGGTYLMRKSSQKLVQAKLDNTGFDAEEQTYLQARKDLEKNSSLNETMRKILPNSKDQAKAVKELYTIGDETGILIDNIQFPTSTLGQKTPTTGSTATTGSAPSKGLTQAKAVEGMPGVMGIDLTVSLQPAYGTSISYDNMIKFLQKVENNRRSMQIKNIIVNTNTKKWWRDI